MTLRPVLPQSLTHSSSAATPPRRPRRRPPSPQAAASSRQARSERLRSSPASRSPALSGRQRRSARPAEWRREPPSRAGSTNRPGGGRDRRCASRKWSAPSRRLPQSSEDRSSSDWSCAFSRRVSPSGGDAGQRAGGDMPRRAESPISEGRAKSARNNRRRRRASPPEAGDKADEQSGEGEVGADPLWIAHQRAGKGADRAPDDPVRPEDEPHGEIVSRRQRLGRGATLRHRPILVGHDGDAEEPLRSREIAELRLERSAHQNMPRIDQQRRKDEREYRRRRSPKLERRKLRPAGEDRRRGETRLDRP